MYCNFILLSNTILYFTVALKLFILKITSAYRAVSVSKLKNTGIFYTVVSRTFNFFSKCITIRVPQRNASSLCVNASVRYNVHTYIKKKQRTVVRDLIRLYIKTQHFYETLLGNENYRDTNKKIITMCNNKLINVNNEGSDRLGIWLGRERIVLVEQRLE